MNILRLYQYTTSKILIILFVTILPLYLACSGGFQGDNENADTFETTIFHPEEIEYISD